jgi:hypothetical protein
MLIIFGCRIVVLLLNLISTLKIGRGSEITSFCAPCFYQLFKKPDDMIELFVGGVERSVGIAQPLEKAWVIK